MPRTRSSTRSMAEAVLFNEDTLEGIARHCSIADLAHLSMASKKLSSAVDDAASRLISAMHARYGGDEDFSPLEELRALSSLPLTFDCLLGRRIGYVEGDEAVVYSSNPNTLHTPTYIAMRTMEGDWNGWDGDDSSALCSEFVMTGGKHFAEFDIRESDPDFGFRYFYSRIGVMRPIGPEWRNGEFGSFCPLRSPWFNDDFLSDNKTEAWGSSNKNVCLYYNFEGYCEWGDWTLNPSGVHKVDWDGMGTGSLGLFDSVKIGLLLDLDEGTLSVYKNGRRLGVMMDGLTGEYVWVVNVLAQAHGRPEQQNVRIRRAPIPEDA